MAENEKPNENQKQAVLIELDVRNTLLEYLNTKPHNEVRRFIDILSQAPVVNISVTPNGQAPASPDASKLASTARSRPTTKKPASKPNKGVRRK